MSETDATPQGAADSPQSGDGPQAQASKPKIAAVLDAHRGEHHIVVLQDFPDPDAIASAFAHQLISGQYDIEVDIVYAEQISHRQNIALVKLLGIGVSRFDPKAGPGPYDGAVFVDNQGTTARSITQALADQGVPTLIVVDHHEEQGVLEPEFSDIRRVGAASTMYAQYFEQGILELQKSRRDHVMTATALMHGILTDTRGFTRAGLEDFEAAGFLSGFSDDDLLEQIMSQARSKQAMEVIRRALGDRVIVESFSIAGIGYLRQEDRDAIPQATDFLVSEENVHTAIVYGVVTASDRNGEEKLVGSLRTTKITMDPDEFIKEAFGTNASGAYFGGGKIAAGGFEVPLGFLAGDSGPDYQDLKWQVYDMQIKQKIFAKIGVKN